MKIRTIMAGMTAACSLALLAGLTPAQADDVKMYKTAPSVEELEKVLGSGAGAKPKAKTRSIVFGDESAPAPAQQAEPAAYQPPPPPPSQAAPASAPSRAEPAPAPARQQAAHKQAAPAPAKAPPAQRVSAPPPAQTQVEVSEKAVGFPINFDLGSANIRPDSRPFLDAIAGLMRKDTSIRLLIEGHTDATGDYVKNMELSRARAASVLAYLMTNYGIDPTRLQAVGKGPTEPLDPSQPYSGENRRVQFRVIGG